MSESIPFSELLGKTFVKIDVKRKNDVEKIWDDVITFHCNNGEKYELYHPQDCCESVEIDDICGNLDDLIGSPILVADEISNNDNPKPHKDNPDASDSTCTWTFYKLATVKGWVDLRWYGTSNGCYAEWAELFKVQ